MTIRYYIDVETGLSHVEQHGVTEAEVRAVWHDRLKTGRVGEIRVYYWDAALADAFFA